MKNRFPEMHDLVRVRVKGVDYFGYVDDIDFDMRNPRVCVEFYQYTRLWVDMSEIHFIKFPEDEKS